VKSDIVTLKTKQKRFKKDLKLGLQLVPAIYTNGACVNKNHKTPLQNGSSNPYCRWLRNPAPVENSG
jgi:hypothetical protein